MEFFNTRWEMLPILLLCIGVSAVRSDPVSDRVPGPAGLTISAVLSDVCDVSSSAEIAVEWKPFHSDIHNISHYEVRHRSTDAGTWSPAQSIEKNELVLRDVPPEGEREVSVAAIFADGNRSDESVASVSLTELTTEPVLTINMKDNEATWKYFICDNPVLKIKEKSVDSTTWNDVPVEDDADGKLFVFEDEQTHEVCFDILVNSRVYSRACHLIAPKKATETDSAYIWVIVGVVAAVATLIIVFGIISYFMLCKQRGSGVPAASFSKQIYSSGRFGKRSVHYSDSTSGQHREHIPLNPVSRSPAKLRAGKDDNNRLVVYEMHRHKESSDLLDPNDNSDKEGM